MDQGLIEYLTNFFFLDKISVFKGIIREFGLNCDLDSGSVIKMTYLVSFLWIVLQKLCQESENSSCIFFTSVTIFIAEP